VVEAEENPLDLWNHWCHVSTFLFIWLW